MILAAAQEILTVGATVAAAAMVTGFDIVYVMAAAADQAPENFLHSMVPVFGLAQVVLVECCCEHCNDQRPWLWFRTRPLT